MKKNIRLIKGAEVHPPVVRQREPSPRESVAVEVPRPVPDALMRLGMEVEQLEAAIEQAEMQFAPLIAERHPPAPVPVDADDGRVSTVVNFYSGRIAEVVTRLRYLLDHSEL